MCAATDWKQKCQSEWKLKGRDIPAPDGVDWKSVHSKKPFNRNLLKNPAPHGLSHTQPPPELPAPGFGDEPPRFEPEGDFKDWTTSTERLPLDSSGIPEGAAICHLPQYSWFTMEQHVDLLGQGLWVELLDSYQPDICIQDWYEETLLHKSLYQLQVKLLGADRKTVIQEHSVSPEEDQSQDEHRWKEVSHKFRGYGPGVRHVHFLHRLKCMSMIGFQATRATDSAVLVRLRD
ncbi:F-box only protein 50 [Amia ocellicauda]|uniref:F-box only protein 50 n=1 Tax=Amia ocellicauda TaxID=2972642 RepID=UPI0034648533|nr:FBX50 protein [Amia calva]